MAKAVTSAGSARLRLRLFIAGMAPNSTRAVANAQAICSQHFPGHELEIVDLLLDPKRAAGDRIIVTPTLIKLSPAPELRLIGDLSDAARLLDALRGSSA